VAGEGWIRVGRVVKAVGLRGAVGVAGTSGALASLPAVRLRRGGESSPARRVLSARPQGRCWAVGLEGVEGREAAEALVGCEVLLPRQALGEVAEGEHLWADLEGLEVVTAAGEALGVVTGLVPTGGVDVLEVRGGRGAVLIPLAPYVTVDRAARKVRVDPPEGLLELEASGAPRGQGS
jgi:16S rRNA processing protein RimM